VKDVFLHLLIIAAFKDGEFLGHQIKPGQAIIGYSKLASELGFTVQQVRTALKKLESTGEITRNSTNKFTVITVENWEDYQLDSYDNNKRITNEQQTSNIQTTNEQQTNNKPLTTSEECKEYKNVKNVKKDKRESKKFAPPSIAEISGYCQERNNGIDAETFFDFYESKGWLVGNNKMKDWKAAVRTWEKRNKKNSPPREEQKGSESEYDYDNFYVN